MTSHGKQIPFFRLLSGLLASSGLLLFAWGCRGDLELGETSLLLSVAISPTPPPVGQSRLIISLADSAGAPVEGAFIVVEGNMSHAGMVPVVDTAQAEEPGRYGISDFSFTMAGDWILDLHATLPDGRWVRTRKGINVVGRMGGDL